jgi:hypothetical protein
MFKAKILADKRGLHPLPLIVLLIIAFIAVGGIAYICLNVEQRAGHAIQIQSVNFEETRTTIYIQNTGKGTVTLSSIHIDDRKFALSKENCTVSSEGTTTVEETKTAKITVSEQYQSRINIKIVCEDGTSIEADFEPPRS